MIYLEAWTGLQRGDDRHGEAARQLVVLARLAPDGVARAQAEGWTGTAKVVGERWAVAISERPKDGAAWAQIRKLDALLDGARKV
jgi:hypothetical protein